MSEKVGTITWISGPVVRARGSRNIGMLELVEVGDEHLVGEVIGLDGDIITAQVYEETSGMRPGAPVFGTGLPLSVEPLVPMCRSDAWMNQKTLSVSAE